MVLVLLICIFFGGGMLFLVLLHQKKNAPFVVDKYRAEEFTIIDTTPKEG